MTEPWNFTEAQRRQFREAQIAAKTQPPEPADSCPACGSESRAECYYVPGMTGMPVTCGSDWHDEDARAPGDHLVVPEPMPKEG